MPAICQHVITNYCEKFLLNFGKKSSFLRYAKLYILLCIKRSISFTQRQAEIIISRTDKMQSNSPKQWLIESSENSVGIPKQFQLSINQSVMLPGRKIRTSFRQIHHQLLRDPAGSFLSLRSHPKTQWFWFGVAYAETTKMTTIRPMPIRLGLVSHFKSSHSA